ncbi:hypothetical protein [Psychrobacter sanguinis]|uniref:hypothetical protein n=1 Tax=Psychrobacter sanguinis TaxID=861445 RepID=UPI0025996BC7|nr:hypothetical protein [Psychrobacter sanguinis]
MPIPFVLGGLALAAAGVGVASGAKGVSDISDAKSIIEWSKTQFELQKNLLEFAGIDANYELQNLGELKVEIFSTQIKHIIEVLRKLKDAGSTIENFNQALTHDDYVQMKQGVATAVKIENGLATGVTAGVLTGMGAYGTVGILGTASTGTAISTLAGAASTNATLAWLGGGSLASGGLGMAGGTMVLGGIVAGPALAITGLHLASKGEEALTEAREYEAKNAVAIAEMKTTEVAMKAITINALEVQKVLLETVKRFEKVKVNDASDPEALKTMLAVGKSLKNILDQPILNSDGKAVSNIRHKCEGYLQI